MLADKHSPSFTLSQYMNHSVYNNIYQYIMLLKVCFHENTFTGFLPQNDDVLFK